MMSNNKQMIVNMMKNMEDPTRSTKQHVFQMWLSSIKQIKKLNNAFKQWKQSTIPPTDMGALLLTPISKDGKTRKDYEEQMSRVNSGEIHMWDDSHRNKSKPGDYFGYVENQIRIGNTDFRTEGQLSIYKIEAVCSPEHRLSSWCDNVGQGDRNVIILSKKCYYTGSISEFKEITGYSEKWNSQGTANVLQKKSDKYLKHIFQ